MTQSDPVQAAPAMAEGAAVVGPALPPPAPLAQGDRMESMDVLRGFALLGILAMNIAAFSGPFAGYMNPTVWPTPAARSS